MTTLSAIIAAILTALSVNLGTFDLSVTGRVHEGTYTLPTDGPAFACVMPARLLSSEERTRGEWFLETHEVRIRLWGQVTTSGPDDRVVRGRLLQEEAKIVLDNARANLSTALWRCIDYSCNAVEPQPSGATAAAGWAFAELVLNFSFRRASGTGV